jgi:uncharacterized membrane protein (DUF441 family)
VLHLLVQVILISLVGGSASIVALSPVVVIPIKIVYLEELFETYTLYSFKIGYYVVTGFRVRQTLLITQFQHMSCYTS